MLCIVWCYLCFWHCLKALRGHLNRHGKLVNIYVVNGFIHVVVGDRAMCPCMLFVLRVLWRSVAVPVRRVRSAFVRVMRTAPVTVGYA
jgi:hypothetical protein